MGFHLQSESITGKGSCKQIVSLANTLQWRHNEYDGVSNHQPHECVLNGLFRRWSKKTSKLRVTGLCEGCSPVTGTFPAQRASNAENVSIWWRHHEITRNIKNRYVNVFRRYTHVNICNLVNFDEIVIFFSIKAHRHNILIFRIYVTNKWNVGACDYN